MSSAIFVNEDFNDYCFLIEASDNYVLLTNKNSVSADYQNPKTIKVLRQYFNPSFYYIEEERTFRTTTEFEVVDISQSFFSRADSLEIIQTQIIIFFLLIFFFNALTRFVRKGGVFFGN